MTSMNIAVVGLGKIGLPLAVQFASRGHHVIGADINGVIVDLVNAGEEPFPGEFDLAPRLKSVVSAGFLTAVDATEVAVQCSDVVVVVVPVAIDGDGTPDFSSMDLAVESIGRSVRPGTLVIFETTLPVGTTRTRLAPEIERLSGLRLGENLFVVFSPERVLTGRVFADLRRYPKLIGGLEPKGAVRATDFYAAVLDFDDRPDLATPNGIWDLGSAEAAELAKLAETTYRDVNIAFANTLALYSERNGIDVQSVIAACNSQPYSHIHDPGVAVGGHCIPVYPHLYLSTDPDAALVRTARQVNAAMPAAVVSRLAKTLQHMDGVRVVVLGATYRGGVKETAFSGVFPLVASLSALGAQALVHDPLFTDAELQALGLVPFHSGESAEAAIVQANHAEYLEWGPDEIQGVRVVIDGRAWTNQNKWPNVRHLTIGLPDMGQA